jgi:hypothetical protein
VMPCCGQPVRPDGGLDARPVAVQLAAMPIDLDTARAEQSPARRSNDGWLGQARVLSCPKNWSSTLVFSSSDSAG